MTDFVVSALVLVGSAFMFMAALGVVRMKDMYMRLSALTKAPTMGVGLLLVANIVESPAIDVVLKALAILAFGFFASPIAAHMICRAAYFQHMPLWEGTVVDELKGHYDRYSHEPVADTSSVEGPSSPG